MGRECGSGSDYAQHMIVCSHRVVVHEQVTFVVLPLALQEHFVAK